LQEAFGILKDQAEFVKVNYGSCFPTEAMKNEVVVVPGLPGRAPKEISLYAISQVIRARVEDIIQKVDFEIVVSGIRHKLAGGIVLTGGGSSMKDITQLFNYFIGLEVHIGSPGHRLGKAMIDEVRNPMYATSIGLVLKGFELAAKSEAIQLNNEFIVKQEVPVSNNDGFLDDVVEEAPQTGQLDFGNTPEAQGKNGFGIFGGGWFNSNKGIIKDIKNWMQDGEDFQE
jgi:cell division ATPase FtsA